jgi:hypothetical protein
MSLSWNVDNVATFTRYAGAVAVVRNYVCMAGGYLGPDAQAHTYTGAINTSDVGPMTNRTALPQVLARCHGASYNNRFYVFGGVNASGVEQNQVYYTPINTDGTTAGWGSSNVIPTGAAKQGFCLAQWQDKVYHISGNGTANVYRTTLTTGASAYTLMGALPQERRNACAVAYKNMLYVLGGTNSAGTPISQIQYAPIDPVTHNLGSFVDSGLNLAGGFPAYAGCFAIGNVIYHVGGATSSFTYSNDVKRVILSDAGIPLVCEDEGSTLSGEARGNFDNVVAYGNKFFVCSGERTASGGSSYFSFTTVTPKNIATQTSQGIIEGLGVF